VRIATWNLEWPTPRRQQAARELLEQLEADVVVTTEDHARPWPPFPHVVDAGNDWGYQPKPDRRKVMAWSRTPWRRIDIATPGASNGRLVVAATTVESEYTIVGVCIPWAAAHVSTGRADRRRWDEHVEFCDVLGDVLDRLRARGPIVVAGDFNQTVPRHRQPIYVWEALQAALGGLKIATDRERASLPLIDHIALGADASATEVRAWSNVVDGQRLSDHAGACADVKTVGR
jgi:endonuclease/exonuclease/phosphatase family metal-dependent hydrolase